MGLAINPLKSKWFFVLFERTFGDSIVLAISSQYHLRVKATMIIKLPPGKACLLVDVSS